MCCCGRVSPRVVSFSECCCRSQVVPFPCAPRVEHAPPPVVVGRATPRASLACRRCQCFLVSPRRRRPFREFCRLRGVVAVVCRAFLTPRFGPLSRLAEHCASMNAVCEQFLALDTCSVILAVEARHFLPSQERFKAFKASSRTPLTRSAAIS